MVIGLLVICLILAAIIALLLLRQKPAQDTTLLEWLKASQQAVSESNRHISDSITRQTREINDRLTHTTQIVGELKREAGQFSEISKSMKDLDMLLKSPKLRGNLGEKVLADLIGQVFPKHQFFLQHHFKNGAIVDAAIQTDAGILPIDSKFPMENFAKMIKGISETEREFAKREFIRDVKKHIDSISNKYILPEEGTMDFALMYVPSETIYYEIAADDSLLDYARRRRVYPVSPTTFYAHLQTILLSFEGKKIESKTREVFAQLRSLQKIFGKFETSYAVVGKHLDHATNAFVTSSATLTDLNQNILTISHFDTKETKSELE